MYCQVMWYEVWTLNVDFLNVYVIWRFRVYFFTKNHGNSNYIGGESVLGLIDRETNMVAVAVELPWYG